MCAVAAVEFHGRQLGLAGPHAVANLLDGRGHNRSGVFGVAKLEMHAAPDVLQLEHGAAPGGSGDGNLHRFGAEFRVTREQGFAAAKQDSGVAVVQGLNLEDSRGRKVVQEHSTFDLRLNDAAVYFVREVWVRTKHTNNRPLEYWLLGPPTRVLWAKAAPAE